MRIVDVTMFYAPASGGVRTYLEAKPRWLARYPSLDHRLLVPGERRGCSEGLCTLPAPRLPFGHGYRFPLRRGPWLSALERLQPDVIEAEDPYLPAWAALDAGARLGVPVVGYYHSDLPRLAGSRLGPWSNRLLDTYVARLYRRFDRVLAPSEVMAAKLRRLGVERVFVQPLGVDTRLFHPGLRDPAVRAGLGLNDTTRFLIFAGRGSREKHIPLLLEVMECLGEGYHLHLAGSGMPRRLPPNVSRSTGFVQSDQVARLLASSDALLHAGDRETFGLVVLEAMACGIPVVGVRAGAVSELVVPGTGLLAEPGRAESLARAVRGLFADGFREMGRIARRHVVAHYGWDRVLPRLLGHYTQLTGAHTHGPRAAHG